MRWIPALLLALVACGTDDPVTGDQPNDCIARSSTPPAAHPHTDGGGSYAGKPCLESGCHQIGLPGAGTTAFIAGGTVVTPDGQPQAGITVRLRPLDNSLPPTLLVTDTAGTFFIRVGATNPFPATPEVTACPKVARMLEAPPDSGNCNGTDCHTPTGHGGPIVLEN